MVHEHAGKGSGKLINIDKAISALIKKGDVFLDIGCGPGDHLESASKLAKETIGLDKHEDSVNEIKSKGFKGIISDATKKIPLKDESIDSVLLSNVMHGFVADKTNDKVLKEVFRVLKNKGRIGVIEFKINSLIGPPKEIRLSKEKIIELFSDKGFSKIKEEKVGLFNYMIIFKKQIDI